MTAMTVYVVLAALALAALFAAWLAGRRARRPADLTPPPWVSAAKPVAVTPDQLSDDELSAAMAIEARICREAAATYQWLLAEQATRIAAEWGVAARRLAQGGGRG